MCSNSVESSSSGKCFDCSTYMLHLTFDAQNLTLTSLECYRLAKVHVRLSGSFLIRKLGRLSDVML